MSDSEMRPASKTSDVHRLVICVDVEECVCGNVGYFVVRDGDGEPMQEQCRFCYTTPWSVFNVAAIKHAYEHRSDTAEPLDENVPF